MKIAICILIIALTILLVLLIRLIIRCDNQSHKISKQKSDYDELKANYIATVTTNNLLEKEVKRLDTQFDELNNMPVQTVIKEVVVNPKLEKFSVSRILTEEVIRFGGDEHKELVKKEITTQLIEDLIKNQFVVVYEDKDLITMTETITAVINVYRGEI